ncbi:MAG TPA: polymer-forming cytoskeletal protein, partial [Gemmatimonadaceae bacterium]
MRPLIAIAALALGSMQASAQAGQTTDTGRKSAASGDSTLAHEIAQRRAQGDNRLPDASSFTVGDRTIAADSTIRGTIAVARGNLDVFGTIDGDAVTLAGNIRVHNGGRVTGDAWAVGGTVSIDGGVVEGERRAVAVPKYSGTHVARAPLTIWEALKLAVGWFAVL